MVTSRLREPVLLAATTTPDLCRRLALILEEAEADISHVEGLHAGVVATDDVAEAVPILIEDRNRGVTHDHDSAVALLLLGPAPRARLRP
jgi:hypothetical protein